MSADNHLESGDNHFRFVHEDDIHSPPAVTATPNQEFIDMLNLKYDGHIPDHVMKKFNIKKQDSELELIDMSTNKKEEEKNKELDPSLLPTTNNTSSIPDAPPLYSEVVTAARHEHEHEHEHEQEHEHDVQETDIPPDYSFKVPVFASHIGSYDAVAPPAYAAPAYASAAYASSYASPPVATVGTPVPYATSYAPIAYDPNTQMPPASSASITPVAPSAMYASSMIAPSVIVVSGAPPPPLPVVYPYTAVSAIQPALSSSTPVYGAQPIVASSPLSALPKMQPMDIAIHSEHNHLYVADAANHIIRCYSLTNGQLLYLLGECGIKGNSIHHFNHPQGIAIDEENERLLVSDTRNKRIIIFDISNADQFNNVNNNNHLTIPPKPKVVDIWGSQVGLENSGFQGVKNNSQYQFKEPTAIAIDNNLFIVFVVDTGADKIISFDLNGGLLTSFPEADQNRNRQGAPAYSFQGVTSISLVPERQQLICCDYLAGKILFLTYEGKLFRTFPTRNGQVLNGDEEEKNPNGSFSLDKSFSCTVGKYQNGNSNNNLGKNGKAKDSSKLLFVCNLKEHCIYVISSLEGKLISKFGKKGSKADQFHTPLKIIFHKHKLYVADWGNNRVASMSVPE